MMTVLNIFSGLNKINSRNVFKKNLIANSRVFSSEVDEDPDSESKIGN